MVILTICLNWICLLSKFRNWFLKGQHNDMPCSAWLCQISLQVVMCEMTKLGWPYSQWNKWQWTLPYVNVKSKCLTSEFWLWICCVVFLVLIEEELHASYWLNKGKQALHNAINVQPKVYKAKNTILFLGDGELENQLSTVHTVSFWCVNHLSFQLSILRRWE